MQDARVIRKYPNRRLYDTQDSRYITLADIRRLVTEQSEFVVIDKKSGEDITRCILLQVINDQEQRGDAMLSRDFLAQVIRAYGTVVPGFVENYLEQSLRLFVNQQDALRGQIRQVYGVDPVGVLQDVTQKNFARFKALQDEVFARFARTGLRPDDEAADELVNDKKKFGQEP